MRRRDFLKLSAAAAAAFALDPERALWTPGAKTIFLPPAPTVEPATTIETSCWAATDGLRKGDIFTIAGVYALNPRTRKPTSHLQQFVVTADVRARGPIQVAQLSPRPIERGVYANVAGFERQRRPKATPLHTGVTIPTEFSWTDVDS